MGLEQAGAHGIRFVPPLTKDDEGETADLWTRLDRLRVMDVPLHLYQNLIDLLQTTAVRVTRDVEIEMDRVYDVATQVLNLVQSQPDAMAAVAGGVSCVHTSLLGLGERDGNIAIDEVAVALEILLKVKTNIDLSQLNRICKLARNISKVSEDVVDGLGDPLPTGQVEIIASGNKGLIDELTKLARVGPSYASVSDVQMEPVDITESPNDFIIG